MKKLCVLLVWSYANCASAQLLKYDNETQMMGAAVSSPWATNRILTRIVDKCGGYDGSLRTSGVRALLSWKERHHAYLDEGSRIRAQAEAMYTTPQAHDEFENMVEKQLPAVADKQFDAYAAMIDIVPTLSGKIAMCNSLVQAISAQKFDLKINDPTLAAYLDKRIHARLDAK